MTASTVVLRRVLMTADAVGGVWRYALELARGLIRSGCDVALAVSGPSPTPEQAAAAAETGIQLLHRDYALEWMPGAEPELEKTAAWLLELEARFSPDLVHLNGFAHAALPWRAPTVVVAHSCVLSWWLAVHGEPAPPEWAAYHQRTLAGLRAADLVVAPTRAFLDQVKSLYGPLKRTRWIWNGCDPAPLPACDKEPLFFAAGRVWDEGKNLGALAAAAERSPWPVSIAGPGAPTSAAGSARSGSVQWLGELSAEAIRQWYARASVFVLPCRYEPFGLAALEAGLAGCALVVADIPTLRELWGGAALFVPPDDHQALAMALNLLAADPALLRLLAERARRRAERYSAARMMSAYLDAYAGLLVTRKAAGAALVA